MAPGTSVWRMAITALCSCFVWLHELVTTLDLITTDILSLSSNCFYTLKNEIALFYLFCILLTCFLYVCYTIVKPIFFYYYSYFVRFCTLDMIQFYLIRNLSLYEKFQIQIFNFLELELNMWILGEATGDSGFFTPFDETPLWSQ